MTDQFLQCRFTKLTEKPCWFAVLQEGRRVSGVVVYRHEKRGRLAFVSVLGAYGDDLPELLLSWSTSMRQQGIGLAHVLTTPCSLLGEALRATAVVIPFPYTRSAYYLTVKPLSNNLPDNLFDYSQWDCMGGDIL